MKAFLQPFFLPLTMALLTGSCGDRTGPGISLRTDFEAGAVEDEQSYSQTISSTIGGSNVTYHNSVKFILQDKCNSCHGNTPRNNAPDTFTLQAYKGANFQPGVADVTDAIWISVVMGTMPPADSGLTLTNEEKDSLTAWINAGAPEGLAVSATYAEIAPLFGKYCLSCHSGAEGNPAAGLALDQWNNNNGFSGVGSSGALIKTRTQNGTMPPPSMPQLNDSERDLLNQWLSNGMKRN